jgi:HK97 gp10 family phage protein
MDDVKVVVSGTEDIYRCLRNFANNEAKKIMRKGMRDGAKVVAKEVKANVPVETGFLKSSIKVRARKKSTKSFGYRVVTSKKNAPDKKYYAAFLELGTKKLEAKHYFQNASDSKTQEAFETTIQRVKLETGYLTKEQLLNSRPEEETDNQEVNIT